MCIYIMCNMYIHVRTLACIDVHVHACIHTCTMYNVHVCVYDPLSVNCRIVCNQLPSELMEKVQLVAGEGIEVSQWSMQCTRYSLMDWHFV